MAERGWVRPATAGVLVLIVLSTVAAVTSSQRQLAARLEALTAGAAVMVRHDVQLNLQRDVAAAVGLARSLTDLTDLDAVAWSSAVQEVADAGVFGELGGASVHVVTTDDELDTTVAALPATVRDELDLRLSEGPLHAIGTVTWPLEDNRAVLGYDVLSNERAAPAARAAIGSGAIRGSPPVEVIQETEAQHATIVYIPVAAGGGTQVRAGEAAAGLISLVFRAEELIEDTLARLPSDSTVRWVDRSPELDTTTAQLASLGTGGEARAAEVFEEFGRSFRIEVELPRSALSAAERRVPVLTGALGGVLVLSSVALVAAWARTTRRAESIAVQRTADLAAATADLEAVNQELRESDRLKDRMLGTVSHDLRSPLTVVRGAAQLLLDRPQLPADQQRDLLRRMLRQTSRLRGLIDELLVSAQVRAGALRADPRPVDLRRLVATITDDLAVGDLVDGGPVPDVSADPVHVERILHNLLMNAVNHGRPPVEVELRSVGDTWVEVEVRDHGDGVPPELREAVFGDFARAVDAGPGYGLGLAIATELTRANGGTLTYRPGAAPGACFVLTLPVAGPGDR